MQPGLRRVPAGSAQLTPTVAPARGLARHLREKLAVLGHFPHDALLQRAGFDATPALDALEAQAIAEHPQALQRHADGLHALALGWRLDTDGGLHDLGSAWPEVGRCVGALPPAWRRSALLCLAFAEDFALLDGTDATVPWLAVALPSHWSPRDKVGRHFAQVHEPVADNRLLITAADHLARLVTGTERWERYVWTVTDHPRLHAHPDRLPAARWPDAAAALPAGAWLRTERQTFIPLPGTAQAVFTILVQTLPLDAAVNTPERAERVHAAVSTMSESVLAYRSLGTVREPLLAWLAQRAHGAA